MTPREFRQARTDLGLSVSQLSSILNVDPRTIRRWESSGVESSRKPDKIACNVLTWLKEGKLQIQIPQDS